MDTQPSAKAGGSRINLINDIIRPPVYPAVCVIGINPLIGIYSNGGTRYEHMLSQCNAKGDTGCGSA